MTPDQAADEQTAVSQELGLYDERTCPRCAHRIHPGCPDCQPAPTAREIPADNDRSTRLVRAIDEVEGNHDALIMVRAGDVISLIAEIKELAPTAREIPAGELAEAEHVCQPPALDFSAPARRWDCPADGVRWVQVRRMIGRKLYVEWRRMPGQPTEVEQLRAALAERGRERDATRAELERLRRRVDELRPMAAHGVRNPPEVIEEMAAELERLRARVAELEPIAQRAREVRDVPGWTADCVDAAEYIVGGQES